MGLPVMGARSRLLLIVVLGGVVGVVSAGSLVLANHGPGGSIPAADGTIHSCFRLAEQSEKSSGKSDRPARVESKSLRPVGDATNCKRNESRVTWNVSGVPGAQGIQGPQGDPGVQGVQGDTGDTGATGATGDAGVDGPQGPQGPPGASSVYTRTASIELATNTGNAVTAFCDAGDVATGGGFDTAATLLESRPSGSSGWRVEAANTSGFTRTVIAYVVCLQTTP